MVEINLAVLIFTILGALGTIVTLYFIGYKVGYKKAKKEQLNDIQRKRYEEIYSPLQALFLTIHVASSQDIRAVSLRIRLLNSWHFLKKGKIKGSVITIWDKRKTKVGAEIEYGGSFPFEEIKKIVYGNEQYADKKLLNLISNVDRSSYDHALFDPDKFDNSILTDEEFELYDHIVNEHYKLNKKYIS